MGQEQWDPMGAMVPMSHEEDTGADARDTPCGQAACRVCTSSPLTFFALEVSALQTREAKKS